MSFNLLENPYFEKYAQKLALKQQTNPEELVKRLEKQKQKAKQAEPKARDYSELMHPKKAAEVKGEIPYKKLEDIMKLNLLEGRPIEEIKEIWLEYHKQKDVIAAAIPTETFDKLMDSARKYPLFVFPIPRSQGYEFIMFQFASNTVHFTPLLCYQVSFVAVSFGTNFNNFLSIRFIKKMPPNASTWSTTLNSGIKASCLCGESTTSRF